MFKPGKKRPLKECLGENLFSNELRHKRRRFDNIVLLRDGSTNQNNSDSRYYEDGETFSPPRRILRAGGKRKKPTELNDEPSSAVPKQISEQVSNENDIINELTNEFKKARLRPVFFTISSFIEQTVDEVGFTVADEPETEVTICLTLPKKEQPVEVEERVIVSVSAANEEDAAGKQVGPNKNNLTWATEEHFISDGFAQQDVILKSSTDIKKTSSMQLRFAASCDMVENPRDGIEV